MSEMNPRVVDNDAGEITVELAGRELRGWSYANDSERRAKMLAGREYVEGWSDARRSADSEQPRQVKTVYIKRWRTLVELPLKYADEIVEALRTAPQTVSKLEAEIGMLREKLSDALASGLPHKSDCAVYSAPAHEPGPCDCGVGASFDDGAFDLALKLRQHNGWVRVVSDTDAVNLIKSFIASRCRADSSPQSAPSDDLEDLVARFSKALLAKLKLARANGRSGWEFDDWEEHCQAGLLRHLAKGDPRDVAAYCAFMWHHGWATKAADRQSQAESVK
jgi:hypothetical protein